MTLAISIFTIVICVGCSKDNFSDDVPQRPRAILWIGTSIPAGDKSTLVQIEGKNVVNAYPNMVGVLLGCNVINNAVGASRLAAGRQTLVSNDNPLGLTGGLKMCLAFWHTLEEKKDIFLNYESYKERHSWTDPLYVGELYMESCSYENLLLPYLNGTDTMPDVIVVDHGYNDCYDNDTDLGNLDDRSNRSTFFGSYNMLVDLIRSYVPNVQIVQIAHYSSIPKQLVTAQKAISEINSIPFCPLYDLVGWNNDHQCPDGLHPHSDVSGQQNRELAYAIAEWLKNTCFTKK